MIYRNTHINWLIKLLKEGFIKGDKFISLSSAENSGGQDNFGDTRIIFNRDILDNQGLEEIFYEPDYFEENPEISQYVMGYSSEQDFYDSQDYDNAEEAAEQLEMDWENNIESYTHEEELVIKEIKFEEGLIEKVILHSENKEAERLMKDLNIPFDYKVNEFKTFEAYDNDLKEQSLMSGTGCTLNGDGNYDCDRNIILTEKYVKNGRLIVNFGKINGSFSCSDIGLTTLEGCPADVTGDFRCEENLLTNLIGGPKKAKNYLCHTNKLTSLEGGPIKIGKEFDCSDNEYLLDLKNCPNQWLWRIDAFNTGITSLEGLPEDINILDIVNCKNLETLYGGPKKINVSSEFHNIKSKKLSKTEYEYWQRLLIGGVLNNETYYKDIFGLMISEDNLTEIHKIKWPKEIIDIMPESLKNLLRSKKAGNKFNIIEYYNVLRFEDFVNEGLDKYFGKLDLSENIKTDTSDVLSSIDLKEVDLHKTLNVLVSDINLEGMNIEQLADNTHFINALENLSLKKEDPTVSADSDTFLTSSLTFMGIYPIQVLEIQDPEYLMIQIGNGPIKLYKVSGSIKDFYDKLTTKTVEITAGDQKWIYTTSNSGNNWELKNNEEGEVFKKVMSTKELEDSLNINTKIEIIS